jgi:hypothetical protein
MAIKTAIEQLNEMGEDVDAEAVDGEPSDNPDFENPVTHGEAEQSAQAPIAVVRTRDMTHAMKVFVAAKLRGETSKASYRLAYPNDTSSDSTISSTAYKLTKHPLVAKALADAAGQVDEALVEDMAASKRYVIHTLITLSKTAKQEGSRLKALELLGKAAGAFTSLAPTEAPAPTAAQLKQALAGHLKLLKQ